MIVDQVNQNRKEQELPSPFGADTDRLLEKIGIFWIQDKGTFVATQFQTIDKTAASAAFTSPTSAVVEPELVKAFREMQIGDALTMAKGQVSSERSFKVRVNKAAKEANRKLEWGEIGTNYVVRVSEIIPVATPAANGTAAQTQPATAGAEKK